MDLKLDKWIRQLVLSALVLAASALLVLGLLLYAPGAHANSIGSSKRECFSLGERSYDECSKP
jgi:hypothetical protein